MNPMRKFTVACTVAACLTYGAAMANISTYYTVLAGSNEVPPVATAATGTASLVLDTNTLLATWTLEFTGLSSGQTGAHFHNAPAGANGGVVFGLPIGSPVNGIWAMTQGQADELAAGNIYVNVHSAEFPSGEIRGQMTQSGPVPNDEASFGAIKALFR